MDKSTVFCKVTPLTATYFMKNWPSPLLKFPKITFVIPERYSVNENVVMVSVKTPAVT